MVSPIQSPLRANPTPTGRHGRLSMIFNVLFNMTARPLLFKRLFPAALCGLSLMAVGQPTYAMTGQSATGAERSSTASLSLCGEGNIVVAGKIAGKASLFLANCQQDWRAQPARLRFSYQANIPGWAFRKAANVLLERNVSAQQWKSNKTAYEAFTANYQAIKAGDVYELSYSPAQHAMRLTLNQQLVTTVNNSAFADYFLIWLGNKPFNATLKQQLLH